MKILCDIDGWQKVVDANPEKDRVIITLHEPMNMYAYKEISSASTCFTVPLHYTGFIVSGLPLYAFRGYSR